MTIHKTNKTHVALAIFPILFCLLVAAVGVALAGHDGGTEDHRSKFHSDEENGAFPG